MEQPVSGQLLHLLSCLAAGAALGIYYDLLAAARGCAAGRAGKAVLDALFCLPGGLLIFAVAMGRLGGVRPYVIVLAALGALGWELVCGSVARRSARLALAGMSFALRPVKKFSKSSKKLFHSLSTWFKIKTDRHRDRSDRQGCGGFAAEVETLEEKAGRFIY